MGLKITRSKGGQKFDKAFAAARSKPGGAKTFTYGGKKYSTALADTTLAGAAAKFKAAQAAVPTPKPRPGTTATKTTISTAMPKANVPLPKPRPPTDAERQHRQDVAFKTNVGTKGVPGPGQVPVPKPRPASPSDRAARRDRAYQTNLGDDAGVGDTTFDKMRKGMQAAQAGAEMQRPRTAPKERPNPKSPNPFELPSPSLLKPTTNVNATLSTSVPRPTVTTPKTSRITAATPRTVKTTVVRATGPQPPANTFSPKSSPAPKGGRLVKGTKATSRPGGNYDQHDYSRLQFFHPNKG